MSKRNKIVKQFVILCYAHKKLPKKSKQKKIYKENGDKFEDILEKKQNKLLKNVNDPKPKKSLKKQKKEQL